MGYKLIFIFFFLVTACASQKSKNQLSGKFVSEIGSELNFTGTNSFLLIKKNILSSTNYSKGYIRKHKGKYLLSSYDSLTTENIFFRVKEKYNEVYTSDSILIQIISPLTKQIDNSKFTKDKFCTEYPLRFIIFNRLDSDYEWVFNSSKFKVPKYNRLSYTSSFELHIVPNLLCINNVKLTNLWTYVLPIINPKTNSVLIYLPDLTLNRFNYMEFRNKKIENLTGKSFEFMGEIFRRNYPRSR